MNGVKKYAVVLCSDIPGDETLQERMVATFSREGERWEVIHPAAEDFLDRAVGCAGYVISGSPMSVVDDAGTLLVRNLFAFLRQQAEPGGAPVIGLCFGSQAIAAALGGEVGRNPSGQFKLGVDRLQWSAAGRALLAASDHGEPTVLVQSHGECVTSLPRQAITLASSATVPHEIFLVAGQFLGIQGHPEVDGPYLQQKFMVYHRSLFDEVQWRQVQDESHHLLHPGAVIALGRHLLDVGRLVIANQLA